VEAVFGDGGVGEGGVVCFGVCGSFSLGVMAFFATCFACTVSSA